LLEKIEKKLSTLQNENKEDILNFLKYLLAKGISQGRIIKCAYTLKPIAEMLNKPFRDATKDDIIEVVSKLENNEKYKERTKVDFKKILKQFYKWLKGNDEEYPPEVKWIKINFKEKRKLPEEILTEEEIIRLAEACTHPRDKAFILTLYESGCRIGELLSLKLKHLQFDEYGGILIVNGKTGYRRVRILKYLKELTEWLDIHPLKKNPEAFLWIRLENPKNNQPLSYTTVNMLLKKVARRVGISKSVNPHAFRHARATHLAKILTEQQLKVYFGWSGSSRMASTYVHLSGKDVDEALLRAYGIKVEENMNRESNSIKICPKCHVVNNVFSTFC
jgi:integrase